MLSKWSFTSNNYIRGIPFGSDFGTLSFKEFKSFNTGNEPSIISMEFDNVMQDMSTHLGPGSDLDKILGKLKVTIELNKIIKAAKATKELKYAPISKLAIEINQDKAIEQDGFLPINANLEFVHQSNKEIQDDIKFIQKVFGHILKKLQITISRKTNLNFHLLKPLIR